jgi:hypothetical protein
LAPEPVVEETGMTLHLRHSAMRLLRGALTGAFVLALGSGVFAAMSGTMAAPAHAQASPPPSAASTQQKIEREVEKLDHEIAKLKRELGFWGVIGQAIPLLVLLVSLLAGYAINKRLNALKSAEEKFSSLVEERARSYAAAYECMRPTALFFPSRPERAQSDEDPQLTSEDCRRMGTALSSWYFGTGGLMMSEDSRDAYFVLMEALRRAAIAEAGLAVQTAGQHATHISLTLMNSYRDALAWKKYPVFASLKARGRVSAEDVGQWRFGRLEGAGLDAERFKDFVLIQTLASRFRTSLTDDIGTRSPPASSPHERYRDKPDEG